MRFVRTEQGVAVYLKGQYYIVNDLTYKLLEMYYERKNIPEIAKELNIEESSVQGLYNEISNMIIENKNYEEDIQFLQPLKVQWKITNQCNIRCKHCYEGEKCMKQLDDSQIRNIFEKLLASNILQLTITGGEALLVKNLSEYVRKCLKKGIMINIFTNGILLNDFVDELGDIENRNLLSFEVSIDGAQTEHDYIRGRGNYIKTVSNIRYTIKKGYKIITNTVINGINKKSIIPMMKELHSIGVTNIQLSNLMLVGWAYDNKDELYISNEELESVYRSIIENIDFDFYYADITNIVYHSDGTGRVKKEGRNTWKCCAGKARITIDFNGDVLICPLLPKFSLGNICELTLEEIWDNPLKEDYIDHLRNLNRNKRTCFVYDQNFSKTNIN